MTTQPVRCHSTTGLPVVFLERCSIFPHEDVVDSDVVTLMNAIRTEGIIRSPLVVDHETQVLLDGHHRFDALGRLGCLLVPCIVMVGSDIKCVEPRRETIPVSHKTVVTQALRGECFPPKTTRYQFRIELGEIALAISELGFNLPPNRST